MKRKTVTAIAKSPAIPTCGAKTRSKYSTGSLGRATPANVDKVVTGRGNPRGAKGASGKG